MSGYFNRKDNTSLTRYVVLALVTTIHAEKGERSPSDRRDPEGRPSILVNISNGTSDRVTGYRLRKTLLTFQILTTKWNEERGAVECKRKRSVLRSCASMANRTWDGFTIEQTRS
ncbi:hypothetical protein BDQ17DRAFT_1331606 [Cyathus striatus]|nr:hypothetical protein BDQ17DRAFT_1331606 [Cyathus striatus]